MANISQGKFCRGRSPRICDIIKVLMVWVFFLQNWSVFSLVFLFGKIGLFLVCSFGQNWSVLGLFF